MRLAYKAEIQPTPTQRKALLQHAGNARWAYNWGLQKRRKAHAQWIALGRPKQWNGWPGAISLHRELNVLKKASLDDGGVPWMYEASKCAPQEALRDLDRAFKNFLAGRARYPRFKSRGRGIGGFRLTGTIYTDVRSVQLPVIGRVRFQPGERGYLPPGKHAQISIMERAGRWFVSIVGAEIVDTEPKNGTEVGLDLGIARLATLSDGTVIENPRALSVKQSKIRRLSKEVSRKKKGSKNRSKARKKLARAHARVQNIRRDALNKVTTILTKSHGRIVIEDLKVKNMTRGGGSRKRGLNRVLLDASFGNFRRMLEYKARLYGCEIVTVSPHYTSQTCSSCGCIDAASRSSQAEFCCVDCGYVIHADLNAAINIFVAGSCPETKNACGEGVRPGQLRLSGQFSMKQESAGA